MIPLYQDHGIQCGQGESREQRFLTGHNGLWFERFFNQYNGQWNVDTQGKKEFLQTLMDPARQDRCCGNKTQLTRYQQQYAGLMATLGGERITRQTTWHFATGLGNPHPVENGLLWHPTLGVPYLPASIVKGLARAWLELHDYDKGLIRRLFGSTDKDPQQATSPDDSPALIAGEILFFDALPPVPVTLRIDTMTPHMNKWYEAGQTRPGESDTLPADWHAPVPVPFLVADGITLTFALAPRTAASSALLPLARTALEQALEYLGAGAKTAAGYGLFGAPSDAVLKQLDQVARQAQEVQDAHQQRMKLASLSDEGRMLEEIREKMKQPANQKASGGYPSELQRILDSAQDWPATERLALADLAETFYKQHNCWGNKIKERKALIRQLRGEA